MKKTKKVMVTVEYLGRSLKVAGYRYPKTINKEEVEYIRRNFYREDKTKALNNIYKVLSSPTFPNNQAHIYRYYFERIAHDVILYNAKWSVNEVLRSDTLVQLFINGTRRNLKVFPPNKPLIDNFRKVLDIGGIWIAKVPTNFPLAECIRIIDNYTPKGGLYVDPCCGWGVRLLSAAYLGNKYVGFDVNTKLLPKLRELAKDINRFKRFKYKIIGKGSENYVKELKGKADFVFTSPPYFALEDYVNGEGQSTNNTDYEGWLKGFLSPMLSNMFRYLKPNRYCLINIKGYDKYDLVGDTIKEGIAVGFEHKGFDSLKNIKRINTKGSLIDNSEDIIVFYKGGTNDGFIPKHLRPKPKKKKIVTRNLFER